MNARKLLILVASLALLGLLAIGAFAFYATAASTEQGVRDYVDSFEEGPVGPYADLRLASYERGTRSSTCATELEIGEGGLILAFTHLIHHGPLVKTPEGMKAGHAYIVSTLDLASSSAELREWLEPVYGDTSPLVVRTRVPLGGDPDFAMEFVAVDHSSDGFALRFDGGEFRIASSRGKGGKGAKAKGHLRLSPLSLRDESEESELDSLRIGATEIEFDLVPERSMVVKGRVGSMRMRSKGEMAFSMESDGIDISFDFKSSPELESLMVGSAQVSLPKLQVDGGESGRVALGGVAYGVSNAISNGFVESSASYRVAEVEESISQMSPMGNVLGSMDGGLGLILSSRLPLATARHALELAETGRQASFRASAPEPELAAALAQGMEDAVRAITRGTSFAVDLTLGRSTAEISVSYEGERPITAQKTYQELLESLRARVTSSVPANLLETFPEFEDTLLAFFVDDGAGALRSEVLLEGGVLLTNGAPNPMLAMMRPVFETAIDWDSLFIGLRQEIDRAGEMDED